MTEIAEKTHAVLSPSGAHRWVACPGSVVLEDGIVDKGSVYAGWGTVCHEVADIILRQAVVFDDSVPEQRYEPQNAEGFVGRVFTVEEREFEFDMEMADCVNDYIAQVEAYWEPGDILLPETSVPLTHLTGEKDATGTSDCIIIKPRTKEIIVIDLKGGKGVQVDAESNLQGVMYASGAAEELDLIYGPFEKVTIVIVQPRLQHVSEWWMYGDTLAEYECQIRDAVKQVRDAQTGFSATGRVQFMHERVDDETAALNPGEKQCRFCKAKFAKICPALDAYVSEALSLTAPPARADEFPDLSVGKQAAAAIPEAMNKVDPEALAKAWKAAPLIEQWITAVRDAVHSRLHDGIETGDLCLYEGRQGNRAWSNADAVEERMKKARIKAEVMYTKKVISPTDAEKLNKEGAIGKAVWSDLAGFITRSDPKPSVGVIGDPKKTPWVSVKPEDFPDLDAEAEDLFA